MKRYVLQAENSELAEHFEVSSEKDLTFEPHFNIRPGIKVPIVIQQKEGRKIVLAEWGILNSAGKTIDSISKDDAVKDPFYKNLLQKQACVIPASGFYKWKDTVKDPLPFYLRVLTSEILTFAGVFTSKEHKNGKTDYSFAVLVMPANALVEPLDDTMPCIIGENKISNWLMGDAFAMATKGFRGNDLLPNMAVYRVPDLVNETSNNSRELIQPIPKLRDDD